MIKEPTEEEISRFRIHEIVSVRGLTTAIQDIYVRTYGVDDPVTKERTMHKHLSFRLRDKPFWGQEIKIEEILKLEGRLLGE